MSIFGGTKNKVVKAEKGVTGAVKSDISPTEEMDKIVKDPSLITKSTSDNALNSNVANAYHTSVVDPLNKGAKHAKDMAGKLIDALHGAGGGGGGGGPSNPPMIQAPGMPQGGPVQFSTGDIALQGPAAAHIQQLQQEQFRKQQMGLAQQLAQRASGQGPFISDLALKQANDTNQAAAFAQLASARGGANPLLARNTMNTSADLAAKTGRDAALAKLQEAQGAQSLLGQVAGQGRQQDIGLATDQAQLQQQAALAGYQGGIQQMQGQANLAAQYQDLQSKYAQMGLTAQQANQLAAIEIDKIRYQGQQDAANRKNNLLGGLMQTGGTIAGAYFGGPSGAAVGNQAGAAAANSMDESGDEEAGDDEE